MYVDIGVDCFFFFYKKHPNPLRVSVKSILTLKTNEMDLLWVFQLILALVLWYKFWSQKPFEPHKQALRSSPQILAFKRDVEQNSTIFGKLNDAKILSNLNFTKRNQLFYYFKISIFIITSAVKLLINIKLRFNFTHSWRVVTSMAWQCVTIYSQKHSLT